MPNKQQQARPFSARLLLICVLMLLLLIIFWTAMYLDSLSRPSLPLGTAGSPVPGQEPTEETALRLDLNRASVEELDALPGIGPVLAQAIADYRAQQQGFFFVEELMDVPGIGSKRFEALRQFVTCSPAQR